MSALERTSEKPPYSPPTFDSGPDLSLYTVSLSAYLPKNRSSMGGQYDGAATGALVVDPKTSKLLLVQRAPHDSMPLRWEIPGGAVDLDDESILHGAARELFEETGLVARRIVELVGGPQEFLTRRGRWIVKFSFLVDVQGDGEMAVELDPNEHVQYVWASEEEARAKKVGNVDLEYTTKGQEETICEAFRVLKERRAAI